MRHLIGWIAACLAGLAAAQAEPLPVPQRDALLQQLATVEAEAARLAPATPLTARTARLAFVIGSIYQGVTNLYSDDRTRYLAVRLFVINTSTEPQSLDVRGIRLRTGGKSLAWQDRPAGIDGYSFQADREHIAIREVQPPDLLAIPAQSVASTWLLYAGLELGPFVPDLALEIPADPRPLVLDVVAYERAVLGLHTERLGPSDCLALVSVDGVLNTVNAGALAAELDRLSGQQTHRIVLKFGEAALPNQFLLDWLKQACQPNPYLHQFQQMPVFPVTTQELHLVLPRSAGRDDSATVHTQLNAAVAAALRTAFSAAPVSDVIAALRSAHPGVRVAALRYGAGRLRPEQLSLVLRQLEDADTEVRGAAIAALGEFSAPVAVQALSAIARGSEPELAAAAVRSLAGSRFPAAHAALAEQMAKGLPLPPQELVGILAEYPRPEWREAVLRFTTASDSRVQQAAMQALARLGHAELLPVLIAGLESTEPRVREEAFQRLCGLGTREADAAALNYALLRLQTEPPSAAIQQFLIRIRDQRAVPLLVKHLDGPEGIRRNILELLPQVGDQSVAAEIVQRYPRLTDSEKVVALQSLEQLDSPLGKPLALAALRSDDTSLCQRAVGYLQRDSGDDVVAAFAAALTAARGKAAQNAHVHFLCNGLGMIGTPAARQVLLETRRSADESTRSAALQGLQALWSQSPARDIVAQAEGQLNQLYLLEREAEAQPPMIDNPAAAREREAARQQALQLAEQLLQAARRIDREFPELHFALGLLHLEQSQPADAVEDFRRAIELDDERVEAYIRLGNTLYDLERFEESLAPLQFAFEHDPEPRRHQWLSYQALALLRLGRLEEGVSLIKQHADEFPHQPVFAYNQACAYSRAVELLRRDPAVKADDPRIMVFTEEALRLLKESHEQNFAAAANQVTDPLAFMRADPDLEALHNVPAFRQLTELDLPDEQRTKPRPIAPPEPPPLPGDDNFRPL